MTRYVAPLLVSAFVLLSAPGRAIAQTNDTKPAQPAAKTKPQNISIELRDAPIRKALERLFDAVKVDFVIEGTINTGSVTARVQDKPFETVLKVILESAPTPLTYEREGDVYIIFPKPIPKPEPAKVAQAARNPSPPAETITIMGEDPNANSADNPASQGYYYGPTYWTMSAPNWQIGGLSIGQGASPWGGAGRSPLQFGAAGMPTFPGNTIFWNPQPGWGGYGYGNFLTFP